MLGIKRLLITLLLILPHTIMAASQGNALIPNYPGSHLYPLGQGVHINGQERQLSYALSNDHPEKIIGYYEGLFRAQGLSVKHNHLGQAQSLTAFTPGDMVLRTILVTPNPAGTVIVASISSTNPFGQTTSVPVPEKCQVLSHTGAIDGPVQSELVFLDCPFGAEQVEVFYNQKMAGAEKSDYHQGDGKSLLRYENPHAFLQLNLEERSEPKIATALVLLWQHEKTP
jgi:hypothetical protein